MTMPVPVRVDRNLMRMLLRTDRPRRWRDHVDLRTVNTDGCDAAARKLSFV
ncbi:hypothetical protein [Paraburkholderia sp. Cpub6]|uniref:hypothetical protein n=1 Tax=Paraburkholderia sp. Cpub6 TaxID=2723094 RepID=UPI00161E7934|nr:hypothetical protein [Paraburkholderia sp. Cpub6]MBB5459014.1 hypothetical protein [Paraburkholderia sp. Cpub6]